MGTTRQPVLHDNLLGGAETTMPAHLLKANQLRTVHNMRFNPGLLQVPKKKVSKVYDNTGTILWLGSIPNRLPGYGKILFLTETELVDYNGSIITTGLVSDGVYRRWCVVLYNGSLYYVNELNPVRKSDGSTDAAITNAPSGRYVSVWYDHLVVGYPTYRGTVYPNRFMVSDLYNFTQWEPDHAKNEADHYDLVEWQSTDYPYTGITGQGKLGKVLWIYTPTAIVPVIYVGKPKVFYVAEENILTGIGNTYPWTLASMNNVHFFFDGIENNFFAFDGSSPQPIGEPVKQFMKDNLNTDPVRASRMWAAIDVERTEVIWRFVSKNSFGAFDKLVRFNYRYRVWSTGSDENVHSFCGSSFRIKTIGELTGTIADLLGPIALLGADGTQQPRLYGTTSAALPEIIEDEVRAILEPTPGDLAILAAGGEAILEPTRVVTFTVETALDGTYITLAWDSRGPAIGFNVFRNGAFLVHLPPESIGYVDTNIVSGGTYTYNVNLDM